MLISDGAEDRKRAGIKLLHKKRELIPLVKRVGIESRMGITRSEPGGISVPRAQSPVI